MTLSLQNISEVFSNKIALNDINQTFLSGKIHALVGENGAGKSTLASILCGDREPSLGFILIDGKKIQFKNPRQAADQGIILVHQRPLLAESISVQENILLGSEHCPKTYDKIPSEPISKRFFLARLEVYRKQWAPSLKMNALVQNIGGDERFYTSLLSALCKNPRFLILDEPTAFLNQKQRQELYKNLQELAQKGTNILVITHSMLEAQQYTDTVTVLAKGKLVAHYSNSKDFKEGCVGYFAMNIHPQKKEIKTSAAKSFEEFLKFSHVTVRPINRPSIFDISFSAVSGQITLIRGLNESGLGTLEDLIFGMTLSECKGQVSLSCHTNIFNNKSAEFTINLAKKRLTPTLLRGKNKNLTALIPSDRTFRASNPSLTIEQMLTVYYTGKNPTEYAQKLIQKAKISIKPNELAEKLSGGMLQRLILIRELDVNPQILILAEPLQGLDSTAASEMCTNLSSLAESGKTILVLSTADFPKEICSKIFVLSDGTLTEKKLENT